MPYSHLLVAVAPTPESRVLIQKAVSIARPVNAKSQPDHAGNRSGVVQSVCWRR